MPKYAWDIKNILYEEDVRAMYKQGRDGYERLAVSLLWTTGGRTSELTQISKEDVIYNDSNVAIILKTLKLGRSKGFAIDKREIQFKRPRGIDANIYLETVINHSKLAHQGDLILPYTARWVSLVTNRLGMATLGKPVAPYHFRHSVLSHMAASGATIDQLKHFKGAKDIQSIAMYLHARPFMVEMELQRRERKRKQG